ncbi:Protein disulfide-isomerase [Abeliophyllum distichum]|uniref:protein disulfide-isomerase n=1 Tax=Abeliophyllum distichum TaxID=126358 RepID=A0ABD1S8L0_9LAMI
MAAAPNSVEKSEEEWRAILSPEQFRIVRQKGTEEDSPVTEVEPYIPFNINPSGMQPVLTTSYLLAFPSILAGLLGSRFWEHVRDVFNPQTSRGAEPWVYYSIYAFFVFLFNIFDIANMPKEIADYLDTLEDAGNLINEEKIYVVGVFQKFSGEEFEKFMTLAEKLRSDYDFGHTLDAKLLPRGESVNKPTLRLLKPFDELFVDFHDFQVDAMEKFIEEASIPIVTVFNSDPSNHPYVNKFFESPNVKKMKHRRKRKMVLLCDAKGQIVGLLDSVQPATQATIADNSNSEIGFPEAAQTSSVQDDIVPLVNARPRQKAKELQEYFKKKKLEDASQGPFFGFIGKNEIANGRWAMFGFAVGMLTEYATGSDFVDQVKILLSNFGIVDLE